MAKKPLFSKDETVGLDADLLTEAEIAELQGEVQAEVDEERKEAARKSLKEKLRKDARRKKGLEEDRVEVTVDLAPYADRILIDNVAYLQGLSYTVPVGRAQVMREAMQRTWSHQSEIDGKSENFYRRQRSPRVVPVGNGAGVVNTTSSILKA